MTRPEDYWINLGENVIGLDVIGGELGNARQAPVYMAVVNLIIERAITDVLDIGCNFAPLVNFLKSGGYTGDYFGVDSNPEAIRLAMSHLKDYHVTVSNLRQLHFGHRAWSCVVVKDVIEHLESADLLREAFRVSKRYAIISTYIPWHDEPTIIHQHEDGYYTNVYNRAEVVALAKDCEFVLIDEQTVAERNGMPNLVTLWERMA